MIEVDPASFQCFFCYFQKDRSLFILKIFIPEYLNKMSPCKEVKAKKRNIMQSSSTFTKISGPIAEVKNSALINDWQYIPYQVKSEQSEALNNKFRLFQIQLGSSRGSYNSRKIMQFLTSFKLISSTYVKTNCYININTSLS